MTNNRANHARKSQQKTPCLSPNGQVQTTAASRTVNWRLTPTQAAILGLLTFGERSGYDLNKLAERSVGLFWAPAKGHIYAVLPRLVELGLASRRADGDLERRERQLYRITSRGEETLRDWLTDVEIPEEPCPNPFLLKLFFGAHMDRGTVLELVEARRREWQGLLDRLLEIERRLVESGDPSDYFPLLTLRAGLARWRAMIAWADETIAELESR